MPKRIQRKRSKGWRMPDNCVYVGRPTKWGNPFRLVEQRYLTPVFEVDLMPFRSRAKFSDRQVLIDFYRFWIQNSPEAEKLRESLHELSGRDLSCWCPIDKACHADVLLELANQCSTYESKPVEMMEEIEAAITVRNEESSE